MRRIGIFLLFVCFSLSAEIAPRYYKEMQEKAPEFLKIKVLDVSTGWCFFCSNKNVKIEAEITEVNRSNAGLKPGQKIKIKYEHKPLKGASGPRPVPILKEDGFYPAYLIQDGEMFLPAARGYSFQTIDF